MRWLAAVLVALAVLAYGAWDRPARARTERVPAERGFEVEPTPEAAPEANETRARRDGKFTGRVRVTGPADEPLAGITITDLGELRRFDGPTDADGWTRWTAEKSPVGNVLVDSLTGGWHTAEEPDTYIRFPHIVPVEVEFVDVQTGRVLEGGAARLAQEAGRNVRGRHERELLVSPVQAGARMRLVVDLEPPAGYAARIGLREVAEAHVSVRARRARLRVPVWPEWNVALEIRDERNRAVSGVELVRVCVAGVWIRVDADPSDEQGRLVVRGIPFMPGAIALFCVEGRRSYNRVRIQDSSFVHRVTWRDEEYVWVPRDAGTPRAKEVLEEPEELVDEEADPRPEGMLRLRARWPDGSDASGVEVHCAHPVHPILPRKRLDRVAMWTFLVTEAGDGFLGAYWPGRFHVFVFDAASGFPHALVEMVPDESRTVPLGPTLGRTVKIRTRQPGTRVLPIGLFESMRPFRGGVQELSAIAGPDGLLVWELFPTLPVDLELTHGLLAGRAEFRAGSGRASVTATLSPRRSPSNGRGPLR